jgi:WD repeat-containing protein 23
MLTGRQQNLTGHGGFSSAERCQVAHRYLPNGGPDKVDFMRSRAYIGQFSQDGSMFVAGFQVGVWIWCWGASLPPE